MKDGGDQSELAALRELAVAKGIELSYWDYRGIEQHASPESLVAVLRALGHDLDDAAGALSALAAHQRQLRLQPIEPVLVAWDGLCPSFTLNVPRDQATDSIRATLILEENTDPSPVIELVIEQRLDRSDQRIELTCIIEQTIPYGRHVLTLECGSLVHQPFLISAPTRPSARPGGDSRRLGVFLPLYALHSARSPGIGDLGDLATLAEWSCAHGCSFVSTLPMLASYLDEPFEPSPYVPVSRLHYNELFIDVDSALELIDSEEARAVLNRTNVRRDTQVLEHPELVEYRMAMALKRPVLESLALAAYADAELRAEIDGFVQRHPEVDDYARFRAAVTRQGGDWHSWPQSMRDGVIPDSGFDASEHRFHLVMQWLLDRQLTALADGLERREATLYLDLPVGVHGGGYDVWRHRDRFMTGLDVGAPPDPLFTGGQNWATPPLHPRAVRRRGHAYWQRVLRAHFRHARMLRIDHVMALHRLYCIPHGQPASEGVYLRYPDNELLAVLCLEAHRAGAVVVGENLGTVPPETNDALRAHGLFGMWIGQFEFRDDPEGALPESPPGSLASLNTHDLPTFAGFWQGRDLELRRELDLIDAEQCSDELRIRRALHDALAADLAGQGLVEDRDAPMEAIRDAVLLRMAQGGSELLQINLEDLWLETEPQNVPGIVDGYPSWRHRATLSLEEICTNDAMGDLLERLAALRAGRSIPCTSTPAETT